MIKASTSLILLASLATLVVLLLLSQVHLMVASQPTPETQDKIDSICRSNEDYGFCNKVFQRDIPQPDMDYVGLTRITIMEAHMNASNTLDFVRALIPWAKDPVQLNYLKVCEAVYSFLKQSFDQAFDAFNNGDYNDVVNDERGTPRVQASCATIFSASTVTQKRLNEMNREMRILITMAVVTASFIV